MVLRFSPSLKQNKVLPLQTMFKLVVILFAVKLHTRNDIFNLMNPFLFSRVFLFWKKKLLEKKNCIWSPRFLLITESFSLDTSARSISWIALICLAFYWGCYIARTFFFWWDMLFQHQYWYFLHMTYRSISSFEYLFFSYTRFLSLLSVESWILNLIVRL